jgi:integrase
MCIKFASMATITKRDKSWFAQVRRKGISVSKSFRTKGQATAWATQTEAEILADDYKSGSEKTFLDAIQRYREEVTPTKKGAKNEYTMLNVLEAAPFASERVSDITTEMLAQWRDSELERVKPASVLRYLSMASAIFEQMRREWQWVSVNPMKDVKKPGQGKSRDRIFTDDEIERILSELHHGDANTVIQQGIADAFLFAIETGMRAGEILKLEWDLIEGRVATLPTTKNSDKRQVGLSTRALEILDSRRHHARPFDVKPGTLASMFKIYCGRAGVSDANFHDTRHTAITRLARKLSPFELARMVGHRNLSQTLAYFNETADQIAAKLN